MDFPLSLEEARKYRYCEWAGQPKGRPYAEGHCAYEVFPSARGGLPYQCTRKNGCGSDGLYCKQHAKRVPGAKP